MCVPGTLAGQKGARALELELVMSHHVGSKSWRKVSTLTSDHLSSSMLTFIFF